MKYNTKANETMRIYYFNKIIKYNNIFFRYALCVGPRRTVDPKKINPSNISDVYLGTSLLWFGWFGFNGKYEFIS